MTTLPVIEYGSKKNKLRLSVGKSGRILLAGKASLSLTEFHSFLDQAKWFAHQVASLETNPSPPPSSPASTPNGDPTSDPH